MFIEFDPIPSNKNIHSVHYSVVFISIRFIYTGEMVSFDFQKPSIYNTHCFTFQHFDSSTSFTNVISWNWSKMPLNFAITVHTFTHKSHSSASIKAMWRNYSMTDPWPQGLGFNSLLIERSLKISFIVYMDDCKKKKHFVHIDQRSHMLNDIGTYIPWGALLYVAQCYVLQFLSPFL
jgi:hypothetical protein